MRHFLKKILQKITGKPRYSPEIEWSSDSWIHNIFRVFEFFFGREVGIRKELTTRTFLEDGKYKVQYEIYTFESFCSCIETVIRSFLKRKWITLELVDLNFLRTDGTHVSVPWIVFSIAHDADFSGTETGTSPITWSHTCTGSNLILLIAIGNSTTATPSITVPTYNAVATTQINSPQQNTNTEVGLYYQVNPATGSHTVSCAFTGTAPNVIGCSTSYTGANLSPADANTSGTAASGGLSLTVTTIAPNCWVVGAAIGTNLSGDNLTNRFSGTMTGVISLRYQDTNGPVAAGTAQTVSWSGGTLTAGLGFSFSPATDPLPANSDQIIIDAVSTTNTGGGAATTLSVPLLVSSPDAIVVVCTSGGNISNTVTINGQPVPLIVTGTSANSGIYLLQTPQVGVLTVMMTYGTSSTGSMVAISLLGTGKRSLNYLFNTITSAVTNRTVTVNVAQANSMLIDCTTGGTVSGPLTSGQVALNIADGGAKTVAVSYKVVGPGIQTMGWIDTNPANVDYHVVVIEPANALSMWHPATYERNVNDIAKTQGFNNGKIGSGVMFNSIPHPAVFYKNSFLHTIGRYRPAPIAAIISKASTLLMMGIG